MAAIEMDGGAEKPVGFDLGAGAEPRERMQRAVEIGGLLKRIDAGKIVAGEGEADIEPLWRGVCRAWDCGR